MTGRRLKRYFYRWVRYIEKIPRDSAITPAGTRVIDRYLWEQFGMTCGRVERSARRTRRVPTSFFGPAA